MKTALTKQVTWMCFLHEEGDLCLGELSPKRHLRRTERTARNLMLQSRSSNQAIN